MYIIIIFIWSSIFLIINKIVNMKSFEMVSVKRQINKERVFVNEVFKVKTIVENNKKIPIPLAYVEEVFPSDLEDVNNKMMLGDDQFKFNLSIYSVSSYERRSKSIKLRAKFRGVYNIESINITIWDLLGLFKEEKEFKDTKRLIVYPKTEEISNMIFKSSSFFGEVPMRTWLNKDEFLTKGIREYTTMDRMKDIHWISSAKMGKLMVKEYDYSMEKNLMLILDIDAPKNKWSANYDRIREKAISMVASIAMKSSRELVNVGLCTNAVVIEDESFSNRIIMPSTNSLDLILEMCARIYGVRKKKLDDFLKDNMEHLTVDTTYMIISYYLDKESIEFLKELSSKGFLIYILDVSEGLTIPKIEGINKIDFKGVIQGE